MRRFYRNAGRSRSNRRPMAEKVALKTWRDEPAPTYASRRALFREQIARGRGA